jgi:hypothetical protein
MIGLAAHGISALFAANAAAAGDRSATASPSQPSRTNSFA